MARYIVQARYGSRRDGQQYGPWTKGTEVDLSEADADWVNRDSPGVLVVVPPEPVDEPDPTPEPEVASEPVDEPVYVEPAKRPDRMRRNGPTRATPPPVDF